MVYQNKSKRDVEVRGKNVLMCMPQPACKTEQTVIVK